MKKIEFTNKEIRALSKCLNPYVICRGGCVFEEMETKHIDCEKCEFPKLLNSIEEKLNYND